MKHLSFVFAAMSLIAIPTSYAASQDEDASTRAPQIETKTEVSLSPSWLQARGEMTASQVLETLGAETTPQQREKIEAAVNARNFAIRAANAQLSSQLQSILKTSDAALAKRATQRNQERELEIIRRRQPARYREMKRKMDAQKK